MEEANVGLLSVLVFAWLASTNAITVRPGENITEGNCTGQLDYFLCNCTNLNTTIDIQLSRGHYNFTPQPSCLLKSKTSVKLVGISNDTTIKCQEPNAFNIVFMRVQDVIITNITMVNCGSVVDDLINQTFYNVTNGAAHFGAGFRFAIMFYQVRDVTITEVTMQNTLGYGIIAFNAIGNVTILK